MLPTGRCFCLFDFLTQEDRDRIGLKQTRTSFLQKCPSCSGRTGPSCR